MKFTLLAIAKDSAQSFSDTFTADTKAEILACVLEFMDHADMSLGRWYLDRDALDTENAYPDQMDALDEILDNQFGEQ